MRDRTAITNSILYTGFIKFPPQTTLFWLKSKGRASLSLVRGSRLIAIDACWFTFAFFQFVLLFKFIELSLGAEC